MKKVLIVASHYPPSSSVGGVIRVAKLVKNLPSNGWVPHVITTASSVSEEFNDELYHQVVNIGRIHRIPAFDMRIPYHVMSNFINKMSLLLKPRIDKSSSINIESKSVRIPIASLYIVPDHLIIWAFLATLRSILLIAFSKIDVIYATSPLQSGLIVGYLLKKICCKPLVIEMRDPWTTNPVAFKRAFPALDFFENKIEKRILEAADRIVVINENFIEPIIQKYPDLSKEKFEVIPNGFDEDDFKEIIPVRGLKRTIVHAGMFYSGRSGLPFLHAFAAAAVRHPWIRDNWEVKLVGSGMEYGAAIEGLGISNLVDIVGTVPHSVALQHILGADLLLLIPGEGLSTMTGKLFEYLAAKRPILVLSNDGAAARLVARMGIGSVVSPENVEAIASTLAHMMVDIQADTYVYPDLEGLLSVYERKGIARRCVSVMEDVLSSTTSTLSARK